MSYITKCTCGKMIGVCDLSLDECRNRFHIEEEIDHLPIDNHIVKRFAKEMKERRIRKGYTQGMLADYLGITRMSVINMEAGRHRPTIEKLYEIACVLECSIQSFFPPMRRIVVEEKEEVVTKTKTKRVLAKK